MRQRGNPLWIGVLSPKPDEGENGDEGERQDQRAERRTSLADLRDGGDDEAREQRLGSEIEHVSLP